MLKASALAKKEQRSGIFVFSGFIRTKKLFYDDCEDQRHQHSLRMPVDLRLPVTIFGSHGIFERTSYVEERRNCIRRALNMQKREFECHASCMTIS